MRKRQTVKNINIGPANLDILEEESDSDVEVMRVENYESFTKQSILQGPGMQALMNTKQALIYAGQNQYGQVRYQVVQDYERSDSHYSRGSIHNMYASPGLNRNMSTNISDHRGNLPMYNNEVYGQMQFNPTHMSSLAAVPGVKNSSGVHRLSKEYSEYSNNSRFKPNNSSTSSQNVHMGDVSSPNIRVYGDQSRTSSGYMS